MKLLIDAIESIFTKMKMVILLTALSSFAHAYAQGVAAGTVISNTAVVSYSMADRKDDPLTIEVTNTFVVAETINATLTSLDPTDVVVPTPATDKVLTWQLTNTGNGTENFTLTSIDTVIGDDFNPSVQTIWLESNGIPGLQNTDTLYQAGNPNELTSDQSQIIYIRSNIPANMTKSHRGNVELIASSTTPGIDSSAIGSSIVGVGDANTDAVVLINNGEVNSLGTYSISTVELQLNKTVANIIDPYSGTDVMSQSLITYQIDVNATGDANSTIENLIIEDPTPENMQFVPGSIKLNGTTLTDLADGDLADFDKTTSNTVTLNLGDVTPPSSQIITITYKVN